MTEFTDHENKLGRYIQLEPEGNMVVTIELHENPHDNHAGKRKILKRTFLTFKEQNLREVRIMVRGKLRMKWRP